MMTVQALLLAGVQHDVAALVAPLGVVVEFPGYLVHHRADGSRIGLSGSDGAGFPAMGDFCICAYPAAWDGGSPLVDIRSDAPGVTLADAIARASAALDAPVRTFANQFGDYPADAFPALPEGFVDSSWGNDTCPSMWNEAEALHIFCDYPDATMREIAETPRFSMLHDLPTGDPSDPVDHVDIAASDEWSDILRGLEAFRIARAFSADLLASLGADKLREIVAENEANADPAICASHDHCDANMPMADAFRAVMGRDILPEIEADSALWNRAWDIAKRCKFWTLESIASAAARYAFTEWQTGGGCLALGKIMSDSAGVNLLVTDAVGMDLPNGDDFMLGLQDASEGVEIEIWSGNGVAEFHAAMVLAERAADVAIAEREPSAPCPIHRQPRDRCPDGCDGGAKPSPRRVETVLDVWARLIPGRIPAVDAVTLASMPADSTCGADCVRTIEAAATLRESLVNAGGDEAFFARCLAGIEDGARVACRVMIAG